MVYSGPGYAYGQNAKPSQLSQVVVSAPGAELSLNYSPKLKKTAELNDQTIKFSQKLFEKLKINIQKGNVTKEVIADINIAKATAQELQIWKAGNLYAGGGAHPYRATTARLPLEVMLFYSAIFFNTYISGVFSSWSSSYEMDPAAFHTFMKMLQDPIGILSFYSFMMTSTAIGQRGHNMVGRLVKSSTEYFKELNKDIAIKAFAGANKDFAKMPDYRLPENLAKTKAVRGRVSYILRTIGPVGMAFGMTTSHFFDQILHDEDLKKCNSTWLKAFSSEIPVSPQWKEHCDVAYVKWVNSGTIFRLLPDLGAMLTSMTISHLLVGGVSSYLSTHLANKNSVKWIFKGLQLGFTFTPMGKVINVTVGKALFSISNFMVFLAIQDHIAAPVFNEIFKEDIDKHIIYAQFDKLLQGVDELKDKNWNEKKEVCKSENELWCLLSFAKQKLWDSTTFSDNLVRLNQVMSQHRAQQLAAASQANQSWVDFTHEYIVSYQSAYQAYKQFIVQDGSGDVDPFQLREYLRGVHIRKFGKAFFTRDDYINEELGLTLDQYLESKSVDMPLAKRKGYLRTERFLTISDAAQKITPWLKDPYHGLTQTITAIQKQFTFADERYEILSLISGPEKTEYLKLSDRNRKIWEFNKRSREAAIGIIILDRALIQLMEEQGYTDLEQVPIENILVQLKIFVGNFYPEGDVGEMQVLELAVNSDIMDPKNLEILPKKLDSVRTPRHIDYLIASMACGPIAEKNNHFNLSQHLNENISVGEASDIIKANSELVAKAWGGILQFLPPRIVTNPTDQTVCNQGFFSRDLYSGPISTTGAMSAVSPVPKTYNNIFEYIRGDIKPSVLGVGADNKMNFDTWWEQNTGKLTRSVFTYLRARYRKILTQHFYPAIVTGEQDIRDDFGYKYSESKKINDKNFKAKKFYTQPLSRGVLSSIEQEAEFYIDFLLYLYMSGISGGKQNELVSLKNSLKNPTEFENFWNSLHGAEPELDDKKKKKLEELKTFFTETLGMFKKSHLKIRKIGRGPNDLKLVRTKLKELEDSQKILLNQIKGIGVIYFGEKFSNDQLELPLTKLGTREHYVELALKRLRTLANETGLYGGMAGNLAESFFGD